MITAWESKPPQRSRKIGRRIVGGCGDDGELGRDDAELFAQTFADHDQRRTALVAGAGIRLMPMFGARQVLMQQMMAGTFAFDAGLGLQGGLSLELVEQILNGVLDAYA